MGKRKLYDGAFKLKVVLEYIEGYKSLSEIAYEYNLHPNQIKNWKSLLIKQAGSVLGDRRLAKVKDNGPRV